MNSYLCKDPDLRAALKRVETMGDRANNRDSILEELAAKNLIDRKPAFLTSARYHNAAAGTLADMANRCASIEDAQAEIADFFRHNGRDSRAAEWLDTLLPLNIAAVDDLARAYERAGTFRGRDEMIQRTERAEDRPFSALQQKAA